MLDPSPFQNPDCYAREIGGCCPKINREHYVSEGILELIEEPDGTPSRTVRSSGLSFLAGKSRSLGVKGLAAKILCVNHNGALSPFDTTGKEFYCAVDRLNSSTAGVAPGEVLTVSGDDLERWMLKTLCGGLYSGNFLARPGEGMKDVAPPRAWLEILFCGASFPDRQGLYWVPAKVGGVMTADPMVLKVSPLLANDDCTVLGLRTWFFGFEFTLLAAPLTPGVQTEFEAEWYRPAGLKMDGGVSIHFDWRDHRAGQEVVVKRLAH